MKNAGGRELAIEDEDSRSEAETAEGNDEDSRSEAKTAEGNDEDSRSEAETAEGNDEEEPNPIKPTATCADRQHDSS